METKNNKDALMVQAVFALSQGCAGAEIDEEACAWFHERYYGWIDKPKTNPDSGGLSPQQVWGEHGKEFRSQFRRMGELAAGAKDSGATIDRETLQKQALSVENDAPCPWCPIRE